MTTWTLCPCLPVGAAKREPWGDVVIVSVVSLADMHMFPPSFLERNYVRADPESHENAESRCGHSGQTCGRKAQGMYQTKGLWLWLPPSQMTLWGHSHIPPLRGLVTVFQKQKCWSSGMCMLHWMQSYQAAPCYGFTHLHSYRILRPLGFFSSTTNLCLSFVHFYTLQLPLVSWWL